MRSPFLRILLLSAAASELLYLYLLRFDASNGATPVLTFLSILAALFLIYALVARKMFSEQSVDSRSTGLILIAALLFRITLLPAGLPHDLPLSDYGESLKADLKSERVVYEPFLLYDSDIWRYIWDSHVWGNNLNPYQHAPESPVLDHLVAGSKATIWQDVRDNVNHPGIRTIYPPAAQIIFRAAHAVAPGSVLVIKLCSVTFDLIAILFVALSIKLLNKSPAWLLLYAWNPLLIKVTSGSGHIDSMVAALIAAACYFALRVHRTSLAFTFALGALSKLAPIVLLPWILKRSGFKRFLMACAIIMIAYLPFVDAGKYLFAGVSAFAAGWEFNAGLYSLIRAGAVVLPDPEIAARAVCFLIFIAFALWLALRDDGEGITFVRHSTLLLGAALLLSPALMPWYVIWILPSAAIAGYLAPFFFSFAVCLSFSIMIDGTESAALRFIEYSMLSVWIYVEYRYKFQITFVQKLKWTKPAINRTSSQEIAL